MEAIHETTLVKPYIVYSLVQAIAHVNKPVLKFEKLFKSPKLRSINLKLALPNLTALGQAIDADADEQSKFAEFVEASKEKTNVRENREVRFKWLCRALTSEHV